MKTRTDRLRHQSGKTLSIRQYPAFGMWGKRREMKNVTR